jgi:hypothetical protein
MERPMLDEQEYEIVRELYGQGFRRMRDQPSGTNSRTEQFQPMLEAYRQMTGFEETEPNAIMHHRIALYGEPCQKCGKPLRSPAAGFCAAWGEQKASSAKN